MKKILSIVVCFVILLSCILPVQASGGVPKEVMDATKSVVRILSKYYNGSATGSGFVIKNESGEVLIATNDHVVSGNPYSISVWVGENELVDAEIVFTTSAKDLCVLRVTDPVDMKPLTLSTEDPQHGAAIYVVGYPGAGDILSDTQAHTSESVTITDGIISAIRTFTIESGADPVKLLQVNAAINSGNSGGPLFNSEGIVIGVNTYKVNADSQGVFGSVDISELWNLLEQHGIEIATQPQEVIPEAKAFPVTTITIAASAVAVLIVILLFVKKKKKETKSLQKFVEAHPNGLGISEAVSLLLPIAIQIRDLHSNGKLHLQISPDSILVSASGVTLKESSEKETDRHTAGFAAPEIYKGVGFGATSDIYSFAAVLYFAATGKTPVNSLQGELLETELKLLEEREPVFAGVIRKSMAFLPQDRTQSMQDLIYGISSFNAQKFHLVEPTDETIPKVKKEKTRKQKTYTKGIPVEVVLAFSVIITVLLWKPYVQPEIDAKKEAARQEEAYHAAVTLMEEGRYEEAIEAFTALAGYLDSDVRIDNCRIAMENAILSEKYQEAEILAAEGKHAHAGIAFAKLGEFKDARERSFEQWNYTRRRQTIAFGTSYPVENFWIGLKNDGTVVTAGSNKFGQREVEDWGNIIEVGAFFFASVGLKADGTIVTAGEYDNQYADGFYLDMLEEIRQWTDIVSILTTRESIIGLKNDGTVVTAGSTYYDNATIEKWTDIVSFSPGPPFIGLKMDGTVVSTSNDYSEYGQSRLSDWKDIVFLDSSSFDGYQTMGITADGSVQYAGAIISERSEWYPYYGKIEGWVDVVDVCGPIGLRANGTVSVFPEHVVFYTANGTSALWKNAVENWENIVALRSSSGTIYGIKEDGTVESAGINNNGSANVSNWTDIKDILEVGNYTFGFKSDGSLVVAEHVTIDAEKWKDIKLP